MLSRTFFLTVFSLCLSLPPLPAQEGTANTPEAEHAAFIIPEGFQVELFASEPMLKKPVQMNWDSKGRLWLACSTMYPQLKPGEKTHDEIMVLEDADGDGKADKSTVFANDLHIPTGILPDGDGVYVGNATEIIHLRDKDGDGKADERKIVLSGFGTEDTHHIVHTFRFGPDGLAWFLQSIYIHSHIETPYGVRRLLGGGFWYFQPETQRLEVFGKGLVNAWGFEFDRWGQSFATDGAGGEGINFVFPNAVFTASPNEARIMHGLNPGQPKHCELEIIENRHFPDDWQGNHIACDFRGNRINRFVLTPNGSSYTSTQAADVLASKSRSFRPIDVKQGPDGALYIIDWANPIIQHGEVDFRDPRRDHVSGRIWRMTAKNRPVLPRPKLAGQPAEVLVKSLASPDKWERSFAKRELINLGTKTVAPALKTWASSIAGTNEQAGHARLEALWLSMGLRQLDVDLARQLLTSPDHRLRAAALRVVWHHTEAFPDVLALAEKAVADENAQVRLWAVSVLGQLKSSRAVELALRALDLPMDTTLDFALERLVKQRAPQWLPEFNVGKLTFGGNVNHLGYALKAGGAKEAVPTILGLLKTGKIAPADAPAVVNMIATLGDANNLNELWALGQSPEGKAILPALLGSLNEAAKKRSIAPTQNLDKILALMGKQDAAVTTVAAELAGRWKVAAAKERLDEMLAADPVNSPNVKPAAMALTLLGHEKAVVDAVQNGQEPERRSACALALLEINGLKAVPLAAVVLTKAPAAQDSAALWEAILGIKNGDKALSIALKDQKLLSEVALTGLRTASSRGIGGGLAEAIRLSGGIRQMDRPPTAEEMMALVAKVAKDGHPARGEAVYRRTALLCQSCHAVGEQGGLIGPNLVSIGASAPVDYLIESLLEPSKKIKEGYATTTVTTKDGRILVGGVTGETETVLKLRDVAGAVTDITKADIADQQTAPYSLMPAGLTASLREDEFVDLVRFLSELGREGDYKTTSRRFVRKFSYFVPSPAEKGKFHDGGAAELIQNAPKLTWATLFARVNGSVPPSEIPVWFEWSWKWRVLQFELDAATPGKATLLLPKFTGLQLWQGEGKVEPKAETEITLKPGKQTFTVILEQPQWSEDQALAIEIADRPGADRAQLK